MRTATAFSSITMTTSSSMSGSTDANTSSSLVTTTLQIALVREMLQAARGSARELAELDRSPVRVRARPAWIRAIWSTLVTRRSSRSVSLRALSSSAVRLVRVVASGAASTAEMDAADRGERRAEVVGHRREERRAVVARRLRDACLELALLDDRSTTSEPVHPRHRARRRRRRDDEREQRHEVVGLGDLERADRRREPVVRARGSTPTTAVTADGTPIDRGDDRRPRAAPARR